MIKTIIKHLNEITQGPVKSYGNYFYTDIATYLDINRLLDCDDENEITNHLRDVITNKNKYNLLLNCKTKNDVQKWLDDITGYIIMHIEEQELIHEYLN